MGQGCGRPLMAGILDMNGRIPPSGDEVELEEQATESGS